MRLHTLRSLTVTVVLSLLAILSIATNTGCLGQRARDTVGVESLNLARDGLVEDARSGLVTIAEADRPAVSMEIDAFDAAIATKDRATIAAEALPRWSSIRDLATAGIAARLEAGTIGPNVAISLNERITRFDALLTKVAAVPP